VAISDRLQALTYVITELVIVNKLAVIQYH